MKKILKSCLALALGVLLAAPHCERALAADEGTLYAAEAGKESLSDSGEKTDHALYEEAYGYISLKSDGVGKINFTVSVETAGKYEIGIVYAAKEGSAARKLGFGVNGSAASLINLACAADWDTFCTHKTTANLSAGENTITVSTPSDFDDDTVKTPNIYAVTYALKEAASSDGAGDAAPELPKTGLPESAYFYMAGAAITLAGAALALKKRKRA